MLSEAARSVWAKSAPLRPPVESWSPLWRHLQDAAAIAGRLWDVWLPRSLRTQLAEAADGEASARTLLVFLAGVHDIGKATPAFTVQVEVLADDMRKLGLVMPKTLPERATMPHGLAGQVILERWLADRHGWSAKGDAAALASVRPLRQTEPSSSSRSSAA